MKRILKRISLSIFFIILAIGLFLGIQKMYESYRQSNLSQSEKFEEDLARLDYIMKNEFSGYGVLSGSLAFDSIMSSLKKQIKEESIKTPTEFNLAIIKAVAAFKDPHTSVYNRNTALADRFPYYLDWSNGNFYLQSGTVEKKWLGAKVIKIGNFNSQEVFQRLSKYTNSPNEAGTAFFMRPFLYSPDALLKEGIIDGPGQVSLEVELNNERAVLSFDKIKNTSFGSLTDYHRLSEKFPSEDLPLFMSNTDKNYWYEYLEDRNAFYLRYSLCVAQGDIEAFWDEVFEKLEELHPDKFIIDVRGNPGGDTQNHSSFINRISQHEFLNIHGKLFTLIDRGTGSAGVSFATDMEKMTQAILVGEKTMDKPNTTSDPTFFTLPHSGLTILVPSLYSLHSFANDPRDAVSPHLPISQKISSNTYLTDEVMDSVLNLTFEGSTKSFAFFPSKASGQYRLSPIRNASLYLKDSIWYFTIDGLKEDAIYQDDSTVVTSGRNISFHGFDSLSQTLRLTFYGQEIELPKIDAGEISLERSILERKFEVTETLLVDMQKQSDLPYFLDRPYFQQRVYRLYNESGFEDAFSLNQIAKNLYKDDPVTRIIDFELFQYEDNSMGQFKAIFPVVGKLLKRYYTVLTTEKIMNDDFNAFIGK